MDEKQCIRQGNRLEVELHVTGNSEELHENKSREYVINGLVVFEVKINICKLFHSNKVNFKYYAPVNIKLRKNLRTDVLTYAIKCSSEQLNLNNTITNTITLFTDTPWFQIYEYHQDEWNTTIKLQFKLSLELDLHNSCSSPLASLLNDTDLTDFELRGKDGSVHVHKNILAGYSPVLRSLVTGDWREAKEGSVNVEGTTKETLQHLKDYMYNDKLPEKGLEQLIVLAAYYMMEDLVQKCSFKLLSSSALNALELVDLAGTHKFRFLLFALMQNVKYDDILFENLENRSHAEKSPDTENNEENN